MKIVIVSVGLLLSMFVWAQQGPIKHPRVVEVEEKLRDEAARYFTRRFPNKPFFIKVEVDPLRRIMISGQKLESLPYFEYESEESVDEWDDPNTPLSFLRHRVTKVNLEVDVSEDIDEGRLAEIKNELTIYLKLLPYRDEVKVLRKFKEDKEPLIPDQYYPIFGVVLLCSVIAGLLIRSGFTKVKSGAAEVPASIGIPLEASAPRTQEQRQKAEQRSFGGSVSFFDPIKTIDILGIKLKLIEESENFPTFKDTVELHALGEASPATLGALVCEMPREWQKKLFPLGIGQNWLESFCSPGQIDEQALIVIDRIAKSRSRKTHSLPMENLLIQTWRLEDKAVSFLKSIPQDHAFTILRYLPQSIALMIAKKAYPGAWGKLLESSTAIFSIDEHLLQDYLATAVSLEPYYDWDNLERYRKDRELLSYLDTLSIEDERDVYLALPDSSFIPKVRKPFYKVFELEGEKWKDLVSSYPLDKWAIVVMNSSRVYVKQITDELDEKRRLVFSQHLRNADKAFDHSDQVYWRREIAQRVVDEVHPEVLPLKPKLAESEHAESA